MRGGEAEGGAASGGLLLMNMMAGMDKLARQEAGHHPKESVKVCLLAVTVCTFTTLDFSMYRIASYIWRICRERHMAGLNLADF